MKLYSEFFKIKALENKEVFNDLLVLTTRLQPVEKNRF